MTEFQPQELVTTFFDNAAPVYYSRYGMLNPDGHSFRVRKQRCVALLQDMPRGAKVADVGCGPATFVDELVKAGFDVLASDIAPHMIEDGRKRFAGYPNVRFEVAPADRLPVPDATFDALSGMGLLEYLNDEDAVYREARRVLKPKGLLLMTYPHYWSPVRIWSRFTHRVVPQFLKDLARGGPGPSGVKSREYRLHDTVAQVERNGFEVKDVVFYNFKLGFRPFEDWFPRATVRLSEPLERFCRTPGLRRIGTGFILLAVKK